MTSGNQLFLLSQGFFDTIGLWWACDTSGRCAPTWAATKGRISRHPTLPLFHTLASRVQNVACTCTVGPTAVYPTVVGNIQAPGSTGFDILFLSVELWRSEEASEDFARCCGVGMAEEDSSARKKATRLQIDWPTDDRHEQCPRAWANAASTQLVRGSGGRRRRQRFKKGGIESAAPR